MYQQRQQLKRDLTPRFCTQKRIFELIKDNKYKNKFLYFGSSHAENLEQRIYQHEREGYRGLILVAKTTNMRKAEDNLLKYPSWLNSQRSSNQNEEHGYIYAIMMVV